MRDTIKEFKAVLRRHELSIHEKKGFFWFSFSVCFFHVAKTILVTQLSGIIFFTTFVQGRMLTSSVFIGEVKLSYG